MENRWPLLLLLLSRFSRVRLCATSEMAAHQAPPSLGFSRQEHWSGVPPPSPMQESEKWKGSRPVVSDSSQAHGPQPTRLLHPWDFPGKSTGVGCHRLLQNVAGSHIFGWSSLKICHFFHRSVCSHLRDSDDFIHVVIKPFKCHIILYCNIQA